MKRLPNSRIEIELTVLWKEWEKYIAPAVAEISAEFKIPGFRPGKAPRNIIEQKVGKEMILNNAAEKAISKNYGDFVRQLADKEKIAVLGHPKVEIDKINENESLIFKAIVAVMPEAKVNDNYKKAIKKLMKNIKIKKQRRERKK